MPPVISAIFDGSIPSRTCVIGSSETIGIDVRVVAATHRSLEQMVERGTFRSDLYYRLNIFPLHIPPLRERREDIGPLTRYFLARSAADLHREAPQLDENDLHALENYSWPGNVRELENYLARAVILSQGPGLYLPPILASESKAASTSAGQPISAEVPHFDDAVKALLRNALDKSNGRIHGPGGAAALLGIKPTTLQGKLRRYRISINR